MPARKHSRNGVRFLALEESVQFRGRSGMVRVTVPLCITEDEEAARKEVRQLAKAHRASGFLTRGNASVGYESIRTDGDVDWDNPNSVTRIFVQKVKLV